MFLSGFEKVGRLVSLVSEVKIWIMYTLKQMMEHRTYIVTNLLLMVRSIEEY